jgi:group I intron endonuclease
MGYIYIIYGPNDKKYIGQTRQSIETRFKQHCNMNTKNAKCPCLFRAMLKYGVDKFSCEMLLEVDNHDLLDEYEKFYIKKYNTIVPNGYNLEGGGTLRKKVNKITREKISKFYKTNNLPMYINIRKYPNYIRYRVQNHPMSIDKTFHTFQEAQEHVEYLNTLTEPLKNTKFTNVKYIQKYKNGYCVDIPNCKTKYFVHKGKDNYQRSLIYLNEQLQHNQTAGNP